VAAFNNIEYAVRDEILHISLPGKDFVMEQAHEMVDLVFEKMDDGPKDIVLDLSGVEYINSSGISVVIRMNLEKNVRLVNPSPMVSDILELTGVLPFVPRFDSVEEAVASFAG